jgi:hypothetical protein
MLCYRILFLVIDTIIMIFNRLGTYVPWIAIVEVL